MLSVMTNDKVKVGFKPKCNVHLEDKTNSFTNFVAVGYDHNTDKTTIAHNADALTLGQALMLVNKQFEKAMSGLNAEQQRAVYESLGGM